jgi:hypothetical protein
MTLPKLNPIKVVRFTGDRKSGTTNTGKTVYREDKIYMGKEYGFVKTANYGPHFIYRDPDMDEKTGEWPKDPRFTGRWSPMCSCGSPSGIVGSNVYAPDASPTTKNDSTKPGQMLVCIFAAQHGGMHLDGSHD